MSYTKYIFAVPVSLLIGQGILEPVTVDASSPGKGRVHSTSRGGIRPVDSLDDLTNFHSSDQI
jgi:hypothetical protein